MRAEGATHNCWPAIGQTTPLSVRLTIIKQAGSTSDYSFGSRAGCQNLDRRCESIIDSRAWVVLRSVDGPFSARQSIILDLEEFSAGHAQFDDVTLICFGPVSPAGFQPDTSESLP
jgi:hypothetical protein